MPDGDAIVLVDLVGESKLVPGRNLVDQPITQGFFGVDDVIGAVFKDALHSRGIQVAVLRDVGLDEVVAALEYLAQVVFGALAQRSLDVGFAGAFEFSGLHYVHLDAQFVQGFLVE